MRWLVVWLLMTGMRPVPTAQSPAIVDLQFAVSADSFEEAAYEFVEYGVADKETMTELVALLQEAGTHPAVGRRAEWMLRGLTLLVHSQPPTIKARLSEWLDIFWLVLWASGPEMVHPDQEAALLRWAAEAKER